MKKLISLLISIVLAVSAFTAAYATEGITATNEGTQVIQERPQEDGVIEEEHADAQKEYGYAQRENGEITQTEYGEEELKKKVIEYAKELALGYLPFETKSRLIQIEVNVDQKIAYLQRRRATYEERLKREEAVLMMEILENLQIILYGPDSARYNLFVRLIPLLSLWMCRHMFIAQFRGLIEAKQHYNYRLN